MGIELVHNEDQSCFRIRIDVFSNMAGEVYFCSGLSNVELDNSASGHIK